MVYLDLPYKTELPTECHKCGAVEIQTYTDGIIFAQLINQKNWRVHHTELATEPQVFKMVCFQFPLKVFLL